MVAKTIWSSFSAEFDAEQKLKNHCPENPVNRRQHPDILSLRSKVIMTRPAMNHYRVMGLSSAFLCLEQNIVLPV